MLTLKKKLSWNKNTIEVYFVLTTTAEQLERNLQSIKAVKAEVLQ